MKRAILHTAIRSVLGFDHRNTVARLTARLAVVVVGLAFARPAGAVQLFYEDFEGYTSFPVQEPTGYPINPGLPLQSEGAVGYWYGGRFGTGSAGTIDSDLAVQKFGGGSNNSHVGRVEDNAALMFHVSTVGMLEVHLQYQWRTFDADQPDWLRIGFYVGNLDFGGSRYHDFVADFGTGWWDAEWNQITGGKRDNWGNVMVPLPLEQPDIWVAIWMKGQEGDYGLVDNICVTGNPHVPEPTSLLMACIGVVGCAVYGLRRRAAKSFALSGRNAR